MHSNSNWGGICGAGFLIVLCAAILWASEHEPQILALLERVTNMLPPKGDDYDTF